MKLRRRLTFANIYRFLSKMCCLHQRCLRSSLSELLHFLTNHALLAFVLCACYFETMRWLWVTLCFVNVILLIRNLEDRLVFYNEEPPDARIWVDPPALYGITPAGYDEFYLCTDDGVRLHCYFLKYRNGLAKPEWTALFLHGNAGNIGHRLLNGAQFSEACCANVLLLDYRGYGMSDGRPSERGFYRDAETALAFLSNSAPVGVVHLRRSRSGSVPANSTTVPIDETTIETPRRSETTNTTAYLAELQVNSQRIAVYGQSIGGAVATYLASSDCSLRGHVSALLLENTFTSLPEIGKLLFRNAVPLVMRLPNWLVKNQFPSMRRIVTVRTPTLFISGSSDQLIPPAMMYALHERAREARLRKLIKFARGTHNDTWLAHGYYPALATFLTDAAHFSSTS